MDEQGKTQFNEEYVTSNDAAKLYRVTNDYVSRLCRQGKLQGYFKGRSWLVTLSSLESFFGSSKNNIPHEKQVVSSHVYFVNEKSTPIMPAWSPLPESTVSLTKNKFLVKLTATLMILMLVFGAASFSSTDMLHSYGSFGASTQEASLSGFLNTIFSSLFTIRSVLPTQVILPPVIITSSGTGNTFVPISINRAVVPNPVVKATARVGNQIIVRNYTYPITERYINATSTRGVTQEELTLQLAKLRSDFAFTTSFASTLISLGRGPNSSASTPGISSLNNLTISNVTLNGVLGLTPSDIPVLSYLSLSGGILPGALTLGVSTTTAGNGIDISNGCFAVNGSCISSGASGTITAVGPLGQSVASGAVTFATSTNGSDFTITGSGATITFNLPSASATNRGVLTSSDWSIFNNKLSSTSIQTSALLGSLINDETGGAGVAVFNASPTFTGTAAFAASTNSGTLGVTGLTTLTGGFLSLASSTINASTTITGSLTLTGSTLTIPALINAPFSATTTIKNGFDNVFSFATSSSNMPIFSISTRSSPVGLVGIGSSTPWGKLSVEMGTFATSFVVSNQGSSSPAFMVGGVNQNGAVGIGTTTTSTTTLLMVGNASIGVNKSVAGFGNTSGICFINPTNTALTCSSDIRLKHNIETLTPALQKILSLNPVNYNWNAETTGTAVHTGFIAQEVEPILPNLVQTDDNGMKTLNYAGFTPYLVSAVQQQQSGLDKLSISLGVSTSTFYSTSTPITFSATSTFALALSQLFATTSPTSTPDTLINGTFSGVSSSLRDALATTLSSIAGLVQNGVKGLGVAVHAGVGIFDKLFAKEVHTDLLCVGSTCVTPEQFLKIVAGSNQTATVTTAPSSTPTQASPPSTPTVTSTSSPITPTVTSTPTPEISSSTPITFAPIISIINVPSTAPTVTPSEATSTPVN